MNKFFRKLPLPVKLMLIGLVPLVFIIYLSLQVFNDQIQKINLLESYLDRIRQSANINTLINELETERKFSYENALNKDLRKELHVQQPKTDHAIKLLQGSTDLALTNFTEFTFLKDLQAMRVNIDTGHPSANVVMYFYTNAIYRLSTLNAIPGGNNIFLKSIYPDLIGQKVLSEMITLLGTMRANIYNALYQKKYLAEILMGTQGVHDVYGTFEAEFLLKGSPNYVREYKNIRDNSALRPTMEYIDTLFRKFNTDSVYTADQWQAISNDGVTELKKLQSEIWRNVNAKVNTIYKTEVGKKNAIIIFIIVAFLFVITVVAYTVRVLTQMLLELMIAAQKISKGATGLNLRPVSNDAMGSLAESISRIDENNKMLADATDAIGRGKFDVMVSPRSNEDILGNAILKMKQDLEKYKMELESLLNKKDEFMSIASHELKTPITSVKAALQIVERYSSKMEELNPVYPFIEKATKQVNHLTNIVNDLMDATKIQAGKLLLSKMDFRIDELIDESYDQLQFDLQEHYLVREGDLNITLYADRHRLEQVLLNLLSNAIKYSPGKEKVIIHCERTFDSVRISITDFGIGIAPDKIPYVFDRYFRVEQSSQNYSGIGLGLFISSEIVKRHSGQIGVISELGKGSTFWFTIPVTQD